MINRRKLVIALGAGALAAPFALFAQQPVKIARIGFLGADSAAGDADRLEVLRARLRDLGYVEGKNIVMEFRWAEGKYERLPELAAELVRLKVDVIVTHGTPGSRAAQKATTTIPIVMAVVGDAVGAGLVASLARPGGNITGSSFLFPEMSAKRLEVLKDALPRIRRVAYLANPDNLSMASSQAMELAAKSLKMVLQQFEVREPKEFESAFAAMAKQRIDAVAVHEDAMFAGNSKAIAALAVKRRLPSIGSVRFANGGGLMGYGTNNIELFGRAALFVDKILKGVKPADIPVEQPTIFELIVNLKTAKALGIKLPQTLLQRAHKIVE